MNSLFFLKDRPLYIMILCVGTEVIWSPHTELVDVSTPIS